MAITVKGATSNNLAEVNANHELLVALPKVLTDTGYAVLVGEQNDGTNGFNSGLASRRPTQVSIDSRLRIGVDQIQWDEIFNTGVLDTGSFNANVTTFAPTVAGGFLNFNPTTLTTVNAVTRIQTYRTIPLGGASSTGISFKLEMSTTTQIGVQVELGLGFASGTSTATDGIYFKLTTAGLFEAVVNFNGTEYPIGLQTTTALAAGVIYTGTIIWDQTKVEFYINGLLEAVYTVPNTVPGSTFARALPVLMRQANITAPTSGQNLRVSEFNVFTMDMDNNRTWQTVQAGMCKNSINVPRGVAAGGTTNYVNSTGPVSAALSNTTAGYSTPDGQWQFAAVAGAETDYALFAYQVPASGPTSGNQNLVITGVHIETFNMGAAVATTPTLLQWAIGVGSTAASLATADSATAGTRATRRKALGVQSLPIAAAIGQNATAIDMQFGSPLYVEAGTFAHLILKMPVGTATASQIIRGTYTLEAHWE